MGFWSNLLGSFGRNGPGSAVFTPNVTYLSPDEFALWADPSKMTVAQMWSTQPHFRTVVTFLARNVAQLGLHVFERTEDDGRRRDRSSVLARSLRDVDGTMTTFELVFALVGDLALYDRAYWWAAPSNEMPSGWMIRRLPPNWVEPVKANPWEVKEYRAFIKSDGGSVTIPADAVLAFPGYHPGKMHGSSPTVDALRDTLREQVEAAKYRAQVWKRGGRVSAVLERPVEAPPWSPEARDRFREDWYANFTGNGPRAGGTPILEDGMQLKRIDFSAQEQQYVEAAKLSLTTVASAFHVNPTMLGHNEGANYSNVREFRKMLYGETLGPILSQIEGRINTFLVPRMGLEPERFYVEFNIAEKLQGNFEEQAAVISSSVGRPWMTADEARARFNMPALGGDAASLVTPLNVLIGGQSSPRDGVTEGRGGGSLPDLPAEPEQQTVGGFTPDDIVKLVGAAATLIRSGFDPESSLLAVGLDPIEHLGLLPITVQKPQEGENPDEEIAEALKVAAEIRRKAGVPFKARTPGTFDERAQQVLAQFFNRQGRSVRSLIGAGRPDWWDEDRWDGELADTIAGLYLLTATEAGRRTLSRLGVNPDDYDEPRTVAYLREAARVSAEHINKTTRDAVAAALADAIGNPDTTPVDAVGHVFEVAEEARSAEAAASVVTFASGFGTVEAAKQQAGGRATKTWRVNSGNPRPSHAAMDGETVGIDDVFSNGLPWPGAMGSDVGEVAGCMCSVEITIP